MPKSVWNNIIHDWYKSKSWINAVGGYSPFFPQHSAGGYETGGYATGGYSPFFPQHSAGGYETGGYTTGGYSTGGYTGVYTVDDYTCPEIDYNYFNKRYDEEIKKLELLYNSKCLSSSETCPPLDNDLFNKRYDEEINKLEEIYFDKCLKQKSLGGAGTGTYINNMFISSPLSPEEIPLVGDELFVNQPEEIPVVGEELFMNESFDQKGGGGGIFINTSFFGVPRVSDLPTSEDKELLSEVVERESVLPEKCICEEDNFYLGLILVGIGTSLLVLDKVIKSE